jgi:hypothetical protein
MSPPPASHLTVGEVARIFQAPEWRVRKIVDSLAPEIQRAGMYRLIPRAMLATIGAKLPAPKQPAGAAS